jgi:hypothetical protein
MGGRPATEFKNRGIRDNLKGLYSKNLIEKN